MYKNQIENRRRELVHISSCEREWNSPAERFLV